MRHFRISEEFTEWPRRKILWLALLLSLLAHTSLFFYRNEPSDGERVGAGAPSSMTKRLSILTIGRTAQASAKSVQSQTTPKSETIPKHTAYTEAPGNSDPKPGAKPKLQWEDYLPNDALSDPAEIVATPSFPEPPANVKQGRVQVMFLVNKTGEIDSILIGENTIDPEFFDVIKNNFSKLGFRPGKINDTATNSRFTMEIDIAP